MRARFMLPRGVLSTVECPVASKYTASAASRGSCDFARTVRREIVVNDDSASFHSIFAFSIRQHVDAACATKVSGLFATGRLRILRVLKSRIGDRAFELFVLVIVPSKMIYTGIRTQYIFIVDKELLNETRIDADSVA